MQNLSSGDREILTDMLNTAASWAYQRSVAPFKLAGITKQNARTALPAAAADGRFEQAKSIGLDDIAAKIAKCERCILARTRKHTVPGFGCPHPLVMVIGEGPGADEDASGLPFVGAAGKLLDKMLEAIKLSRHTNCFIGNIVKCRPPLNRDPKPEETEACSSFLQAQIRVLKPKMILAVGRIAAQNLLETSTGIGKLHGQFFSYKDIPLMATYHPSALLRDPSLKKPAWEDLKLFRSRLSELAPNYMEAASNG